LIRKKLNLQIKLPVKSREFDFFFLKFQLAPFYIVDRNYGPLKAMKQSWHDTDMVFVPLAMLDLLFVGIQLLTAPLVFGPLICHIGLTVASAIVYAKWLIDEDHPDIPKLEEDDAFA